MGRCLSEGLLVVLLLEVEVEKSGMGLKSKLIGGRRKDSTKLPGPGAEMGIDGMEGICMYEGAAAAEAAFCGGSSSVRWVGARGADLVEDEEVEVMEEVVVEAGRYGAEMVVVVVVVEDDERVEMAIDLGGAEGSAEKPPAEARADSATRPSIPASRVLGDEGTDNEEEEEEEAAAAAAAAAAGPFGGADQMKELGAVAAAAENNWREEPGLAAVEADEFCCCCCCGAGGRTMSCW